MKITYEDKVSIQNDESVARKNKVTDTDMNEIKEVVNANANEQTTMQTYITNIKAEQTTQNTNISNLQKDNETNKKDITEIKAKDTEQDKYIAELEAENARLREDLNGLPKGQASGESIDLSDSAEMRCELKISGNSRQETREGYNIWNLGDKNNNSGDISFLLEKGKYVLSFIKKRISNSTISNNWIYRYGYIKFYDSNDTLLSTLRDTYSISLTSGQISDRQIIKFTAPENTVKIIINFSNNNADNNLNTDVVDIQITKGTEEKPYEQYGAMPSPDYPSEVESCGDNINLFDKSTTTDGKYINSSGFEETQSAIMHSDYIQIELNKDFYISGRNEWASIALYDKNKAFLERIATTKPNGILNITNSNCKYIIINALLVDKETLKIEKGSIPTQYSPYGQGCINEVICNKNIFDISKRIYTATAPNTVSVSSSNGIIRASITSGAAHSAYLIGNLKVGQKYTISWKNAINLNSMQLSQSDNNGKQSTQIFRNYNTTDNVTFEATTEYVLLNILASSTTLSIEDVQIEKGSTATSYEEHKKQVYTISTQQPFRANGDTRDTFIKKNNKWYEHHPVIRKIFDGTEHWKKSSTYSGGFYINWSEFDRSGKHFSEFYCNYAKYVSTLAEYGNNIGICFSDAACSIRTTDGSNINTVELWKAYLQAQYEAGTPVYVDYIAETPLDIECTEEQSTILFDIEQNAKTYDKVTHMYSTDEVSPNVEITYKKDIETLFANTLIEGVG